MIVTDSEMADLISDIWRLGNKISIIAKEGPEAKFRGLVSTVQKIERFLSEKGVTLSSPAVGEEINPGLNVDVVLVEKSPGAKSAAVKEVVEPGVSIEGKIVRRPKVIVVEPS